MKTLYLFLNSITRQHYRSNFNYYHLPIAFFILFTGLLEGQTISPTTITLPFCENTTSIELPEVLLKEVLNNDFREGRSEFLLSIDYASPGTSTGTVTLNADMVVIKLISTSATFTSRIAPGTNSIIFEIDIAATTSPEEISITGLVLELTNISDNDQFSIDIGPTGNIGTTYSFTKDLIASATFKDYSLSPGITQVNTAQGTYAYCAGETPPTLRVDGNSYKSNPTGLPNLAYTWQKNTGSLWESISRVTSATYIPLSLTETTSFRRITQTLIPACEEISDPIEIKVTTLAPGSISFDTTASLTSLLICDDTPVTLFNGGSATTTTGEALTYAWYSERPGTSSTLITGENGPTLTLNTPETTYVDGTRFYRTASSPVCNTIVESNRVTLNIASGITAGIIEINGTADPLLRACFGEAVTLEHPFTNSNNYALDFAWQVLQTNGTWLTVSTNQDLNINTLAIGEATYRQLMTINGTNCTYESTQVTLIAHDVTGPGTISLSATQVLTSRDVCNTELPTIFADNTPLVIPADPNVGLVYEWESRTYNATTSTWGSWTPIVSATGPDYTLDSPLTANLQIRRNAILTVNGNRCTVGNSPATSNIVTLNYLAPLLGGTTRLQTDTAVPAASNLFLCENFAPVTLVVDGDSSGSSLLLEYQWEKSTNGGNSWQNISQNGTAQTLSVSSILENTDFRRRTTLKGNTTCFVYSSDFNISVNTLNPGAISFAANSQSNTLTLCANSTYPTIFSRTDGTTQYPGKGNIEWLWEQSIDNGTTWTPLTAFSTDPNFPILSGTIAKSMLLRRMAQYTDGTATTACTSKAALTGNTNNVLSIEVLPAISGGSIDASATAQFICSSGSIPDPITVTDTNSTIALYYQWERLDNSVWTQLLGENARFLTFTPTTAPTATTRYRRGTYNADPGLGNVCVAYTTNEAVVNIYSTSNGEIEAQDNLLCEGEATVLDNIQLPITNPAQIITYAWQYTTDDTAALAPENVNWITIATNNPTYSTGPLSQTTTFRRIERFENCAETYSNNVIITVLPSLESGTTVGTVAEICSGAPGGTLSVGLTDALPSNVFHQWYSRTDPNLTYNAIPGAQGLTFDVPNLLETTYFTRETYYAPSNTCAVFSDVFVINVTTLDAGEITGSATLCKEQQNILLGSVSAPASATGFSVQWQQTTNPANPSSWLTIAGATNTSYTVPLAPSQQTYYRRKITNTLLGCEAFSNTVTLDVITYEGNPDIQFFGFQNSSSLTFCGGSLPEMIGNTLIPRTSEVVVYEWFQSTDNQTWSPIPNTNKVSYEPPSAFSTSMFYKREVRLTRNGVSCVLTSNILEVLPANPDFIITAGAIFTTDATSIAGGDTQIICFDTTPNLLKGDASTVKYQGADQPFTYQWYSSTDNLNFSPVSPDGTDQDLRVGTNLTRTTYYFRTTIPGPTITSCTAISSNRVTIIVPESGNLNIQGQQQRVICPGETIQTLTSARTIGTTELNTLSFQWWEKIGTGTWSTIAGATNETYSPSPPSTTTSFKRIATYSIDIDNDGLADCPQTPIPSNELTFTVNTATPGKIDYAGNLINSNTAQVCYNTVPETLITDTSDSYSIVGTMALFQWQTSTDSSTWTNIPVTTEDYSPTALTQTTFFRRLVGSLQSPSNITCWSNPAESNVLKLEVFPELTAPQLSASSNLVCDTDSSAGQIEITNFLNNPNTTYTWYSSTNRVTWDVITSGVNNFSGSVLVLDALNQTTYYKVEVTQTTLPNACKQTSNIAEIPVIAIDAGIISFQDNSVSNFYYPTCTTASNSIFISSFNGAKPTAANYENDLEVFWEGRSTASSAIWQELNLTGIQNNSINDVLEVFGTLSSAVYIRRGARVPTFGGNFCISYSNSVLIDVTAPNALSSFDPKLFTTDASCPGASDGKILLSGTAVLPPSATATQKQRVDLSLTGFFDDGDEFTVTIEGTPYTYVARSTATNLTLLSKEIGDKLIAETLPNLSITNNTDGTISIESTNADIPFAISTSVTSARNVRFYLEYKRGSRPENTYTWARFINGLIDPSFSNPGTLDLTDIPTGSYELTISNGPACNTVTSPRFVIEEPLPLAGAVTNINGAVVCENEALELVVSGASTYTNQTYRWEFSTDNATWQSLQIGGLDVTSATVSLPNITRSTYFRRVLEFTDASGTVCGATFPTTAYLVTLNSAEPGDIKALEPIVCIGSIPLDITTDAATTYNATLYSSYVWERTEDVTGPNPQWLEITGVTAENLAFTVPLLNSTKYRRTAVRTINGISCTSVPSNEVVITVRELPIIDNTTIATTGLTLVSCFGAKDGAISLDPSTAIIFPSYAGSPDPNTDAFYRWSNLDDPSFSANTPSLTELGPGRYQLQLTYDFCTVLSNIFRISEPDVFEIDAIAQCDNTLTIAIAGGSETYEVTLTAPNGQQTINYSNKTISFKNLISGGTYTVSVNDIGSRSCLPLTETLTIPTDLVIDEATINVTDSSCFGVNDGRIILNNGGITISGGTAPYTYSWTTPSGATFISQNISNLEPGTYVLSARDQKGCSVTTAVSVASVANLEITSKQVTNEFLACNGASNASIAIQIASDPNSALQINWFKNGTSFASNVSAIENLSAGTYRVEVSNLNGANTNCIVEDTFEISEPEVFTASLLKLSLASCADGAESSAYFKVQGGTSPYSYRLNNGVQQTLSPDLSIANLPSGSYSITLTDSNACTEISIPVTVPELEPLEVTIAAEGAITPIICDLDGSISAEVSGGTAPYFYIWSGPGYSRTGPDLSTISDITNAGAYTLTVIDANQCNSTSITVQIRDESTSFGLEVTVENESCNPGVDGNSIKLNPTGTVINPFNVQWELWSKKADPACNQDCFEWAPLANSNSSLTLNGLAPGRYRVMFSDSGTQGCNTLVKIIEIPEPVLSITQTLLKEPTCNTPTGEFSFTMEQRNLINLFLNGNLLAIGDGTLSYESRTKKYTLVGLSGGQYTLRAVEQINTSSGPISGCETATSFIISEYRPLAYQGETEFEIDICESTPIFTLNEADISGGTPFLDNQGNSFYNYTWYGPKNFGVTGVTSISIEEGDYRLEILDAEGCIADPIIFSFKNNYKAIEVTSNFIRPSCDGNQKNGAINITLSGGKLPYSIVWEKENIDPVDGSISYEIIATNAVRLNNLDEGRYRLNVTSNLVACGNINHPANSFTKIFSLEGSDTLNITEGPILSDELCKGNPGTITVKLFDTTGTNETPTFYYNGSLATGERTAPNTYAVYIDSPTDSGLLTIVNEFGCQLTQAIELAVPDAQFSETSTSFEAVGQFLTGEPISFTNTTEGDFAYAIWDFGDGTILEQRPENDSDTVTHTYEFDGVFETKLSIFNGAGCFTILVKELVVGKGYQLLFPNAFSPNEDGINDYFEGKFTGFTNYSIEIYTPWGGLVYASEHETKSSPKNWGWNGNYSNGAPYTEKYFRFVFRGTLVNETIIVKSGEAIILR